MFNALRRSHGRADSTPRRAERRKLPIGAGLLPLVGVLASLCSTAAGCHENSDDPAYDYFVLLPIGRYMVAHAVQKHGCISPHAVFDKPVLARLEVTHNHASYDIEAFSHSWMRDMSGVPPRERNAMFLEARPLEDLGYMITGSAPVHGLGLSPVDGDDLLFATLVVVVKGLAKGFESVEAYEVGRALRRVLRGDSVEVRLNGTPIGSTLEASVVSMTLADADGGLAVGIVIGEEGPLREVLIEQSLLD